MPQFRRPVVARLLVVGLLLASQQGSARCAEFVATLLDDSTVTGSLIAWSQEFVTLAAGGENRPIAVADLLTLRPVAPTAEVSALESYAELVDGSRIPISRVTVAGGQVTLHTDLQVQPLRVSTDAVQVLQWGMADGNLPAWRSRWDESEPTHDVLVVLKQNGTRVELLEGILGDITEERVQFTWDGEPLEVRRSKVGAVTYYHAHRAELEAAPCRIQLADGVRLAAKSAVSENGQLLVTTVLGQQFQVEEANLVLADFTAGKVIYLSDLEPLREQWIPLIRLPVSESTMRRFGRVRRDTSLAGEQLTLVWPTSGPSAAELKSYSRGLALRSGTEVVYRLPGSMRRLTAVAGIDPATAAQGSVQLKIQLDNRTVFDETIRGGDVPRSLDLPLAGERRLKIRVDYGENLDLGDRLHLVNARLLK